MRSPSLLTVLYQLVLPCFISSLKALLNSISPMLADGQECALPWHGSKRRIQFVILAFSWTRSLCLVTSVWFLVASSVFWTLHIMNREVVTEDKFIRNKDWDSSWSFMWAFFPHSFIRFCSTPLIAWRRLPQSQSLTRAPADDFCHVDGAQFF